MENQKSTKEISILKDLEIYDKVSFSDSLVSGIGKIVGYNKNSYVLELNEDPGIGLKAGGNVQKKFSNYIFDESFNLHDKKYYISVYRKDCKLYKKNISELS
jgi:hypothetical protein